MAETQKGPPGLFSAKYDKDPDDGIPCIDLQMMVREMQKLLAFRKSVYLRKRREVPEDDRKDVGNGFRADPLLDE